MTKRSAPIAVVVVMAVLPLLAAPAMASHNRTYYPILGDLYYDGWEYADSLFRWDTPTWQTAYPGYEHDLTVESVYFSNCTSWTDLPYGYDDCPTAGVDEPTDGLITFAFGTFRFRAVQANTYYWGSYSMDGGWNLSSPIYLKGQETKTSPWCPFANDNIWCRSAQRTSGRLVSTTWSWSQPSYRSWDLDGH